ncbi:MAG: type IV pilus modification protein PilV [Burkholderiales bacterium PBB1]|nr:MAG: type IV pilus modification protein PilV [Burkholderiales bacterium PBB1]
MSMVSSFSSYRRGALADAQQGFTLVEILVAIVVLSFGVLGVVGMQAAALQSNRAARNQSTAVALGRELADIMRGNKDVALATSTSSNPYLVANYTGTLPTISANCFTAACTSTLAVAQYDMNQWLARVSAALPQARVVVCFDDTPYASSTGLPQWDCTSAANQTLVVKIGWTQKSLDSSASAPEKASASGSRPAVVLPLIAGSAT